MLRLRLTLLGLVLWSVARPGRAQIESLTPPRYAKPPAVNQDQEIQDDLQKKREDLHRRERLGRPPPVPYAEKQQKALLKEALTPHERWLLLELSLVFCGAQTHGNREGYTCEPTSHFNVLVRKGGKAKDGKVGLWYGARLAPFIGGGFYKGKPGNYGLTYFGPMIGIGKIDPVPADEGHARASSGSEEINIPRASGWVLTGGIAAVTRAGKDSDKAHQDKGNDFETQGLYFDAPGAWLEARYLHILFGAVGVDGIVGVQSGREKLFVYGGLGFAAWD